MKAYPLVARSVSFNTSLSSFQETSIKCFTSVICSWTTTSLNWKIICWKITIQESSKTPSRPVIILMIVLKHSLKFQSNTELSLFADKKFRQNWTILATWIKHFNLLYIFWRWIQIRLQNQSSTSGFRDILTWKCQKDDFRWHLRLFYKNSEVLLIPAYAIIY